MEQSVLSSKLVIYQPIVLPTIYNITIISSFKHAMNVKISNVLHYFNSFIPTLSNKRVLHEKEIYIGILAPMRFVYYYISLRSIATVKQDRMVV